MSKMPPKDSRLKQKRIFVGFNSAGAAGIYAFTRVLQRRGYRIDFYGLGSQTFKMPVDFLLTFSAHPVRNFFERVVYFFKLLPRYDLWHFNFLECFFFYPLNLLILKLFGKKIILTCRGADVRDRLDFLPRNFFSQAHSWPQYYQKQQHRPFWLRLKQKIRLQIFLYFADKVVLTGPFLAGAVGRFDKIIPYARDIPGKINLKKNHQKIKILHIPSESLVKGTEIIQKTFRKLQKKYKNCQFKILEPMPRPQLLKELDRADIVVDQILVGWYGGQAVEAMAKGKIVVAFLNPTYLALVDFGQEIPIWKTTPWSLAADLETLLEVYPAIQKKWAQKSFDFARKIHRSEKIAQQYLEIYRELE